MEIFQICSHRNLAKIYHYIFKSLTSLSEVSPSQQLSSALLPKIGTYSVSDSSLKLSSASVSDGQSDSNINFLARSKENLFKFTLSLFAIVVNLY